MTLLLCRQCLNWESPQNGICPFCRCSLSIAEPDPPLADLARRFGQPLIEARQVGVLRGSVLVHGSLVLTSLGLAWMPECVWKESHYLSLKTSSRRSWWDFFSPWRQLDTSDANQPLTALSPMAPAISTSFAPTTRDEFAAGPPDSGSGVILTSPPALHAAAMTGGVTTATPVRTLRPPDNALPMSLYQEEQQSLAQRAEAEPSLQMAARWMEHPTAFWINRPAIDRHRLLPRTLQIDFRLRGKARFYRLDPGKTWPREVTDWLMESSHGPY
ncbi:MAG: hypothetical protein C0478_17085 [Planctomyces sp.]|nr:hypothetical protein [Planctomyces sp.]